MEEIFGIWHTNIREKIHSIFPRESGALLLGMTI
jgi:hypothetical protein